MKDGDTHEDIPTGEGAVIAPEEVHDGDATEDRSSVAEGEQALELADEEGEPDPELAAAAEEKKPEPMRAFDIPPATSGGAPRWAKIPKGMKFPRGRQVLFLRFRAEWTDTPDAGNTLPGETGRWRQCIVWALSDADEKHALNRAMGDVNRAPGQLAKQMVRAVDGHEVDWTGSPSPGNIDRWWNDIGGRCRGQLIRLFTQLHVLSKDEQRDFFENCIAVRSTG